MRKLLQRCDTLLRRIPICTSGADGRPLKCLVCEQTGPCAMGCWAHELGALASELTRVLEGTPDEIPLTARELEEGVCQIASIPDGVALEGKHLRDVLWAVLRAP